ncbi:hypothetical protein [Halopelagius fulvigenes]|uniref:Uncharacterized protein n=1 Tax=Halopelagius fulvigenes TaxID=1198324 RepID=A0ABD5U3N8_9EURY
MLSMLGDFSPFLDFVSWVPSELWFIIIGSILTAVASWTIQYYRDAVKRRSIRNSLRAEIKRSKEDLDFLASMPDSKRSNLERDLSTRMYDQHYSQLGLLSSDELDYATDYYRNIERIIDDQEWYNELVEADPVPASEDFPDHPKSHLAIHNLQHDSKQAIMARTKLLSEIDARTGFFWWVPFSEAKHNRCHSPPEKPDFITGDQPVLAGASSEEGVEERDEQVESDEQTETDT